MFQKAEMSPQKSSDSSLSEFLWSTKMRMMANQVCTEVLPILSRLSGLPKSRIRVGMSEAYSYLASWKSEWIRQTIFRGEHFFTRYPVLPPCFSHGNSAVQPTILCFTSTVSPPISGYYSAKCKFLSIIGVSPAVIGEVPEEFNCNNVVVGVKINSTCAQK